MVGNYRPVSVLSIVSKIFETAVSDTEAPYTQHSLRPFIDSETNHKRHFIKIPFINKGIEFIDLPSIFKDRSVTSSIPTYFQNSETSIIFINITSP